MLATLLRLSRPRFWLYLAGPFLVGSVASVQDPIWLLSSGVFWYSLFYFLIPANIFLYGVNDLTDGDTDAHNPKKTSHEQRMTNSNRVVYFWGVVASLGLALPLFVISHWFTSLLLISFLMLSIAYSARPFRLKAKPFVDSISNVLYAFPALIAFYQTTQALPATPVLVAMIAWTAAMHLFSAVPDIESDRKAGLSTTAVVLGSRNSLLICTILWFVTAGIGILYTPLLIPLLIYPVVSGWALSQPDQSLSQIYWWFPWINGAIGFGLFLLAVLL